MAFLRVPSSAQWCAWRKPKGKMKMNKLENKKEYRKCREDYLDHMDMKKEMGKDYKKVIFLTFLEKKYIKLLTEYEKNNPYKFNLFVKGK
jgi:hypothetical protein